MTNKDKKIIEDSEREGIPITALLKYLKKCEKTQCSLLHTTGILTRLYEFKNWQMNNARKTKLPD